MKRFALFGFKRSGKTTLGKRVSQILGVPWIDLDAWILETLPLSTLSIPDLHRRVGESAFRDLEESALALLKKESFSILSLGGGSLIRSQNRQVLQKMYRLIYLDVSWEHLEKRFSELPAFAASKEDLQRVYRERASLFQSIDADRLSLDGLSESESAEMLANHIKGRLNGE